VISIRKAEERGHANHGWLDSWHSFSFAGYQDPKHMGFGPLRVLNDDSVAPGQGFGMHAHQDMDIVTYVLSGALEHKDTLGTGSVIRHGDVQRMSAGTGVQHSEFNHSKTEPVHFLQIWIIPPTRGAAPVYEQQNFSPEQLRGQLRLIASPDGREGSILIHQEVAIYDAVLGSANSVKHQLQPGRKSWVQVVRGAVEVNGKAAGAGDGVALEDEPGLTITAREHNSEILVFDLP